jgi:hypothetical protein
MVSRPDFKGGSYMKVQLIDDDYTDGREFLSEKIELLYKPLGAAEIPIAVREPGEPFSVAVLKPSRAPGTGPAALAVQQALRIANQPSAATLQHTALVAMRSEPTIVVGPRPHWDSDSLRRARLLWYIAELNLSFRAARLVAIVDAYPLHDELDVELPPDRFYDVAPSYFTWGDRRSGDIYEDIFRRMIQRYSRELVNGPPAVPLAWLDCDAAQVLSEVEQQLSMLVQGLVKARSDAVDGDGAMPLDPAPLPDTITDGVPAPAVLPLRALLSEHSSPVAEWPGSLPPVSPITPLSHDDDSGADDATDFPAVPSPIPTLSVAGVLNYADATAAPDAPSVPPAVASRVTNGPVLAGAVIPAQPDAPASAGSACLAVCARLSHRVSPRPVFHTLHACRLRLAHPLSVHRTRCILRILTYSPSDADPRMAAPRSDSRGAASPDTLRPCHRRRRLSHGRCPPCRGSPRQQRPHRRG